MLSLYLAYNYLNFFSFFSPLSHLRLNVRPGRRRPWSEGSREKLRRCARGLEEDFEEHFAPRLPDSLFFGARCCPAEWRQLLCAVVFSFIQPSKRTPFG